MDTKYTIEDLKYNLPDYISKKIENIELVKEIENNLKVNPDLKKEYERLKATFNFLSGANFESPPESYFTNLPIKINQKLSENNKTISLWEKLSIVWKILIPAIPMIILFAIIFNSFEDKDIKQNSNSEIKSSDITEKKHEITEEKNQILEKERVIIEDKKSKDKIIQNNKTNKKINPSYKISKTKEKVKPSLDENKESEVVDPPNNLYADKIEDQDYTENEEDDNLFYSDEEELEILEDEFFNLTPEQQKEIIDNLKNVQI